MKSAPTEIVFSLSSNPEDRVDYQAELFCYGNGPVKVPGPWKRGRPKGALNKKSTKLPTKPKSQQLKFQFIHTTPHSQAINPESRAVIRKHVKQKIHCQLPRDEDISTKSILEKHYEEIKSPEILGIELECSRTLSKCNLYQIPGVDPFNKSCIKLEPYMHDLLNYFSTQIWRTLYTLENLANVNPIHTFWLPLAFQDPAMIHSLIGCADIYVSGYRIIREGGRGLRHLQASIAIVNLRLEKLGKRICGGDIGDIEGEGWEDCGVGKTKKCRVEIIICLVAAIALLEYGQGRTQNWKIHMLGLKHIIGLAGGIQTLLDNPHILAKVYRADLYGSLDCSEAPFFSYQFPPTIPTIQHPAPPTQFPKGFNTPSLISIHPTLYTCIQHFSSTFFFWSQPQKTEHDAEFVRGVLTNTQYLLLSQTFPLNSRSECLRITLILFSLTILNERPKDCSVGKKICGIFRERFEGLRVAEGYGDGDGDGEGVGVDLLLWAVFLGVCVLRFTECEDREWLVGTFRELCMKGDVEDLEELKGGLEGFLWVECIHLEGLMWAWGEMGIFGEGEMVVVG